MFTKLQFLADGSPALMRTVSKGKTAKKKTKGEEGQLSVIHCFWNQVLSWCCNTSNWVPV